MMGFSSVVGLLVLATFATTNAARSYKMVCYYSSWATYRNGYGAFTSHDIDPDLCTHVVYAFAGLDNNFRIRTLDPWLSHPDGKDDYGKFVSLKRYNPDLKLMIGVGGWNEGSPRYSQMAASAGNRLAFIDSVLGFIRQWGFDGLNLDWQYPANRGGLSVDKRNYVILLQELQAALSKNNYILGVSAAANLEILNGGYDVPEVTKYVDYVSLLTYDYHGSWDTTTGMNSPLFPRKGASIQDRDLTQDATVQYWIRKGADKSKLLLGLATYGRTFVLRDRSRNLPGDPFFRPGNPGRYTQQDGFLGYNEITELFSERDGWLVRLDDETKTPYAVNDDLWISYDDEWSYAVKAQYAKNQGLGGVMVWSLDTDDFTGLSGRKNPLVNTLKEVLEDGKEVPTPGPTQPTPPRPTPTRPPIFVCKSLGTFQDPADCTRFYTCLSTANGFQEVLNNCPPGLAFDNISKACNWKDAVPECHF